MRAACHRAAHLESPLREAQREEPGGGGGGAAVGTTRRGKPLVVAEGTYK